MIKQYLGKQTKTNRKQPLWTCKETGEEQTSTYWRQWSREKGYIQEKFEENRNSYQIVNPMKYPPEIIKTIRRIR